MNYPVVGRAPDGAPPRRTVAAAPDCIMPNGGAEVTVVAFMARPGSCAPPGITVYLLDPVTRSRRRRLHVPAELSELSCPLRQLSSDNSAVGAGLELEQLGV